MDNKDQRTGARRLLASLDGIQELDPGLYLSTVLVLLYVAAHPGCASADIVRDLGLAQPAVTRHLQRLTVGSPGASAAVGKGLELVAWVNDAADPRRRLYTINARGEALLMRLLSPLVLESLPERGGA